jgi:hypothetical protein
MGMTGHGKLLLASVYQGVEALLGQCFLLTPQLLSEMQGSVENI